MVKEIIKDTKVLSMVSERFNFDSDLSKINDIVDTANFYTDKCLGLAAVQIGYPVKLICVRYNDKFKPMINPMIVAKSKQTFINDEMCLSLDGVRQVKRHRQITALYQDENGKQHRVQCGGELAVIIQHECDHLKGVLI